jgi:GTP:adenosylcobinamide-phosphate guanylyltransferase/aminoglycoside phosphotransferase
MDYIILQAGGLGTRLGKLTRNKPKALVAIDNKPIIFHIFDRFPRARFIIITSYKSEVFEKYLKVFAKVDYSIVFTEETGTCSGIKSALGFIPDNERFLLVWSDLVLTDVSYIKNLNQNNNYIMTSNTIECRWTIVNNQLVEQKSNNNGVIGLFIFKNKDQISDIPHSGEFVRYLSIKGLDYLLKPISEVLEIGTLDQYEKQTVKNKSRPFNLIEFNFGSVIKKPLDEFAKVKLENEVKWYRLLSEKGYKFIPKLINDSPFEIERIRGNHQFSTKNTIESEEVLLSVLDELKNIHSIHSKTRAFSEILNMYINKPLDRFNLVNDLIPFSTSDYIKINGILCKNIVKDIHKFEIYFKNFYSEEFESKVIHGDPTLSNILFDEKLKPYFIDPRGNFGNLIIYGDEYYDYAKVYYSLFGNYDKFNFGEFNLFINKYDVEFHIEKSSYESVLNYFERRFNRQELFIIKLIHSTIWLSLTSYVWYDYDQITASFYNSCLEYQKLLSSGDFDDFLQRD